jgi:hypothetical protein
LLAYIKTAAITRLLAVISAQVVNHMVGAALCLIERLMAKDPVRLKLSEIVAEEKKEGMEWMKEFKKRLSNFPKVRINSLSLFISVVHWLWII